MTERMTNVLAADRLVSALAERRAVESDDRVTIALAALVAEIDAAEIPVLGLPRDPAASPFARRAGVAAATVAVLALSSTGIAAAVTGDPLLPLRYVVGKLYEHAYPEGESDPDRWFVGQKTGDSFDADPGTIRYASLEQSRSNERLLQRSTGAGPDGPGAAMLPDPSQLEPLSGGGDAQIDGPDESSDTGVVADGPGADPGAVPAEEPTAQAPDGTTETSAQDEPPASVPGEPSPEIPGSPPEDEPEILTGKPEAPAPDPPGGDRTGHGRDGDVVTSGDEPPGKPGDPGSQADGRPGTHGDHGGGPEHTPPAPPDSDPSPEPGRPAGPPGPPVSPPHERGPLPGAAGGGHQATARAPL